MTNPKCTCAEITCAEDCTRKHTHKTFFCEECDTQKCNDLKQQALMDEAVASAEIADAPTVEEIKKEFDAWYHSQREMNHYIMRDWFLQRFAECEAKGRKEGVKAERARIVEWAKKLKGIWRPYDTMINVLVEHLTTQSEDNNKEV